MTFNKFKKENFRAGENKLVFMAGPNVPSFAPPDAGDDWYTVIPGAKTVADVLGGIGSTVSGVGTVAGAGGRLLEGLANLVDIATISVGKGIIGLEKGGVNLYNYLKDKYVGQADNLPEYGWMAGDFKNLDPDDYIKAKGLVVSKSARAVMHYQYRMAILDALIYQAQALYNPAVNELSALLTEKESRDRAEWKKDNEMDRLREKIKTKESLLDEGNLGNGSMRGILLAEKEADEKALEQLQGQTTKEIMWAMPQTQRIEFPTGSGHFVTRYFPNKGKKVKINIDKVCDSLKSNVSEYAGVLNKYTKEKIKLKYWAEKSARRPSGASAKSKAWYKFWGKGETDIQSEYDKELETKVKDIKSKCAAKFDSEPADPIYYLMEDPFEIRQNQVGTYKISPDYIAWQKSRKIPDKLVRFGCTFSNGKIVKQTGGRVFEFTLGEAADVATRYPDNVHRRLPAGEDPNNKKAWTPPMP